MFQERMKKGLPVGLHEFFYPLMQGYDSVALKADLEIGGTDQTFNMLFGRTLRKHLQNQEKHVLTVPLLLGLDGRKMSKSYDNSIGISESPKEQFGKIMSMKDDLIFSYFKLCTDKTEDGLDSVKSGLEKGINPRDLKAELGRNIVTIYHSKEEAKKAEAEFERVFKNKEKPSKIPTLKISDKSLSLLELLSKTRLLKSRAEIKRLTKEGAVKVDDKKILDFNKKITPQSGMILQVGKRKFIKIAVE